jgi:hypothetical protein
MGNVQLTLEKLGIFWAKPVIGIIGAGPYGVAADRWDGVHLEDGVITRDGFKGDADSVNSCS